MITKRHIAALAVSVTVLAGCSVSSGRSSWCEDYAEVHADMLAEFVFDDSDASGTRCTFIFVDGDSEQGNG